MSLLLTALWQASRQRSGRNGWFQSDWKSLNSNPAASRFHKILRWDDRSPSEQRPRYNPPSAYLCILYAVSLYTSRATYYLRSVLLDRAEIYATPWRVVSSTNSWMLDFHVCDSLRAELFRANRNIYLHWIVLHQQFVIYDWIYRVLYSTLNYNTIKPCWDVVPIIKPMWWEQKTETNSNHREAGTSAAYN